MRVFLFLIVCLCLAGCASDKAQRADVLSSQKGGPSAQIAISFLAVALEDEAAGKPCPPAWRSYPQYWHSRMEYIATHESKVYYERVFLHFNDGRIKLGLVPMTVPTYESFHKTKPVTKG